MARFGPDDDLRGAEFVEADMTGARFRFADLSGARVDQSYLPGAVMRGVDLTGADIDGEIDGLRVNGVEVAPLVAAELHRRYPGWADAHSDVLADQRASFEAALRTWSATVDRVASMPPGTEGVSVDGEWSVVRTLRHLVFAVDGWVRFGLRGIDDAFSPIGVPFSEWDTHAPRVGVDLHADPSWDEVRAVHADRVDQVRALYDVLTEGEFAGPARRLPPWEPADRTLPVFRCLGVIVNEHWAHHQFVERDLDRLDDEAGRSTGHRDT
ncbi:DinB family protein [Isoptericola sp. BMS4]|uniref:DinB family protein n=1 Tax=Isoptericola sp. BMS4 TaxID=2527875 RepID=UPI001422A44A|nr:DinB family protein [Isoptericola sp. BMS4]